MSTAELPAAEASHAAAAVTVSLAGERDLGELLALMREYCDFYEVNPSDQRLLALARTLIADPRREGAQLIARDPAGGAVGVAALYLCFLAARAAPTGTINDLVVHPHSRRRAAGGGLSD